MKAKIKETGEVIEVHVSNQVIRTLDNEVYVEEINPISNKTPRKFIREDLIFNYLPKDIDWEERRYELSKSAMEVFLFKSSGSKFEPSSLNKYFETVDYVIKKLRS